ncbi:MAG TPA: alkaline phosphatase D family protein [Polyangiales bacterium]|nr:alkaline phosphatase D family protein [Polyangiales bacterium]
MRRREFLKRAGCFVASAAVPVWVGCGDDDVEKPAPDGGMSGGDAAFTFPQGVASGDPKSSSVVLWTRVVPEDDGVDTVKLELEVSKSDDFDELVVQKSLEVTPDSDFTARVLVEDLEPGTIYYYRFRAKSDVSRVGRTRTAPERDADVAPYFAWAACQDYSANFYGAYRQMLNDDEKRPAADQIQFVLHVGDFMYETRDASFMQARNDSLELVALKSKSGKPRVVGEFPSGGGMNSSGVTFAKTVDDYRHVYKTYLMDADLQDARARWPFICVWDDHEFTDDCWQTQANYDRKATTDEPSQKRRVAASQAWFEYVPTGVDEFEPVEVEDAPYTQVIDVDEPNNQKALGAITIYRSLRWGKHVDMVLTDNRLYRSDHALAEESSAADILIFHPRAALPKNVVNDLDAGKTAYGGQPKDMAGRFKNTRKDSPPGTILGAKQKQWWKDQMKASDATWRIWGNSLPLLRIILDGSKVDLIQDQLILSADGWDGYNTERKELMAFLKENDIRNVVSLSGDHHAHYAGVVYDDFDAEKPQPVMVDFATAGIASSSQFSEIAGAFDSAIPEALAAAAAGVRKVIVYDATKIGGTEKAVPNMNALIRYGSAAANEAAASNDLSKIEAARDPAVNPHLRYADTRSNGYGLAHVTADAVETTLVTIERKYEDIGKESPGIRGTAKFKVPHAASFADVKMAEPELSGKKPFPLR